MATLTWDQVGQRFYQTGVDHGVLYLHDGTAVPWNGLVNVEDSTESELKSYFLDGVKYLENLIPGSFSGKLTAFTYPEEFDSVNGIGHAAPGLNFYEQPAKSFGLSYRTKIGNDSDGIDHGYKIHVLYNVFAKPDGSSFDTLGESVEPIKFSWSLSGTPSKVAGYRPTAHISVDSTKVSSSMLQLIEGQLYGTSTSSPYLPSPQTILGLFGSIQNGLVIVDNGDGTWVAVDEDNLYITMTDSDTFSIANADVTIIDANTYEISSTNVS